MGTSVEVEAIRDEATPEAQWQALVDYFKEHYPHSDFDDELISSYIDCPYSMAYLDQLFDKSILEKIKGSKIELHLYYMDRDPDESLTL